MVSISARIWKLSFSVAHHCAIIVAIIVAIFQPHQSHQSHQPSSILINPSTSLPEASVTWRKRATVCTPYMCGWGDGDAQAVGNEWLTPCVCGCVDNLMHNSFVLSLRAELPYIAVHCHTLQYTCRIPHTCRSVLFLHAPSLPVIARYSSSYSRH